MSSDKSFESMESSPSKHDENGEIEESGKLSGIAAELMNSPEALAAVQRRLASMEGMPSGYVDSLPKCMKRRVNALKNLQVEALKIEAKMAAEFHAIEVKYQGLLDPIHEKRASIISGEYEPTDVECDFPSDDEDEEDEDSETQDKEEEETKPAHGFDEDTKGIPEFWLTVFKNVALIHDNIQPEDLPILAHLRDVRVKNTENPMGFSLEFHFSPNEFFTNEVLTKSYVISCEVDPEDPFSFEGTEVESCSGCQIDWKKGKNVTLRTVTKKQRHKTKGFVKTITREVQTDSFFNFFSPPDIPENLDDLDDDTNAILVADFEIGESIRQRVVQRAVLYFTGEALDSDYEDEEDDDEDFDEDDEENDDDYVPPKGGKGKHECKQQ